MAIKIDLSDSNPPEYGRLGDRLHGALEDAAVDSVDAVREVRES